MNTSINDSARPETPARFEEINPGQSDVDAPWSS